MKETTYQISIVYSDGTGTNAKVTLKGTESQTLASAMMITRGWLKASSASIAALYDEGGRYIVSYK